MEKKYIVITIITIIILAALINPTIEEHKEKPKCIQNGCEREMALGSAYCRDHSSHSYSRKNTSTKLSTVSGSSSNSNSYDKGYEDMYFDEDYDEDKYNSDLDYADGVDDAEEDMYEEGELD